MGSRWGGKRKTYRAEQDHSSPERRQQAAENTEARLMCSVEPHTADSMP